MRKLKREDRRAIVNGLLSKDPIINTMAVLAVGDYLDFLENTIILLKRGYKTISDSTTDETVRSVANAGVVVCEETVYEDVTI